MLTNEFIEPEVEEIYQETYQREQEEASRWEREVYANE